MILLILLIFINSHQKSLKQEGYCHFGNITNGAIIDSYYNITSGNVTEMKMALALYGPLTVLINTRPRSFKFYDSGIYYDKRCGKSINILILLQKTGNNF